jgi:hypothetical protein
MIFGHWDDKLRWALPATKDKYVAFRRKPKGYILMLYRCRKSGRVNR